MPGCLPVATFLEWWLGAGLVGAGLVGTGLVGAGLVAGCRPGGWVQAWVQDTILTLLLESLN